MSQLYELRVKIEKIIEEKKLDPFKTKGAITLKSGVLLGTLSPNSPDDQVKIEKVKAAVKEILQIAV